VLKLSGNEIGPSGGEALARAVTGKDQLQELDLNCMLADYLETTSFYCIKI